MARQVKFKSFGDDEPSGGILLDDGRVICGCCGHIFEPKEYVLLEAFNYWVNLTNEIIGDDT